MEKQVLESQKLSISSWPSPQDYNEALQLPHHSFADVELANGTATTDALGLPRPITGMFASVYEMQCGTQSWAVRCFLNNSPEQIRRYVAISQTLQSLNLACTVAFNLQNQGIRVRSNWYPILKMEWCNGVGLGQWLQKHYADRDRLESFLEIWQELIKDLKDAGIAHGDLQHGNILVQAENLKLVDYDGMYIPQFAGLPSHELGHRNYQHPKRSPQDFGPWLDNFSAWLIYLSVKLLTIDPELWNEFKGGDECILFHKEDLEDPENSELFHALEKDPNDELKKCSRTIRYLLSLNPCDIPELNPPLAIPEIAELPFIETDIDNSQLPDWMKDEDENRFYRENADYANLKRRGKTRRAWDEDAYSAQLRRRDRQKRRRDQEIRAEEHWHKNQNNNISSQSAAASLSGGTAAGQGSATSTQFSMRPGASQQLYKASSLDDFKAKSVLFVMAAISIITVASLLPNISHQRSAPVHRSAQNINISFEPDTQKPAVIDPSQWKGGQYIHITEAKKLWKAGDLDKARDLFAQTTQALKGNNSVDATLALATAYTSLGKLDLNSGDYKKAIAEYKNAQKYWDEYDGKKTADYVDVTAGLAKAYAQDGQLENADKTYKWLLDLPYPSSVADIRQELAKQYAAVLWSEGKFKNLPNLAAQLNDLEKYKRLMGKEGLHH